MPQSKFLIVGGGNMAFAIVSGALKGGFSPSDFLVADPDPTKRAAFESMGVRTIPSAKAMVGGVNAERSEVQVLLAVKPQMLNAVAADIGPLPADRVVISILAGATTARVREALGGLARIVRIMPNTPARIGLGCAALALGPATTPADAAPARARFGACGIVLDLPEAHFDAFTALAGSGPAYLFLLVEAMADAGVRAGLDPDTAAQAARQTVIGAAQLLAQSPDAPAQLRAAVTSRGGTTEAALAVLTESRFPELIARAVLAAAARGAALAQP
jgi:pyrroline-5-carboxylate reductase